MIFIYIYASLYIHNYTNISSFIYTSRYVYIYTYVSHISSTNFLFPCRYFSHWHPKREAFGPERVRDADPSLPTNQLSDHQGVTFHSGSMVISMDFMLIFIGIHWDFTLIFLGDFHEPHKTGLHPVYLLVICYYSSHGPFSEKCFTELQHGHCPVRCGLKNERVDSDRHWSMLGTIDTIWSLCWYILQL